MRVEQKRYDQKWWWQNIWQETGIANKAQLVLWFWSPKCITDQDNYDYIRKQYPNAGIVLASTAGEIMDNEVFDDTLCLSALYFEKTPLKIYCEDISNISDTFEVCSKLSLDIPKEDLTHVLVISDWLTVNWDELIRWLRSHIPDDVSITWGLSGNSDIFTETFVWYNQIPTDQKKIVIIWFYGKEIQIWSGSVGWWDKFWVQRVVTRSEGNIVYSLDDKPILDLYKQYLWDMADDLPESWILFPLTISDKDWNYSSVRTLFWVNEEQGSVSFGWDIPQWYTAQLMRANFERLIDGAEQAGDIALQNIIDSQTVDFALLISCVGRRLVLKQRIYEETEAIRGLLWPVPKITGFYSYWEIGPSGESMLDCRLHNQTMTITLFREL